jgi:hypothetical protein
MQRKLFRLLGTALFLFQATWASADGLHPRPAATDYPAHEQAGGATYAAASLSKEQVRKTFVSNLSSKYIVLEVAVYPAKDGTLQLNRDDFFLRIGNSGDVIRPVAAEVIAGIIQRQNTPAAPSRSDIAVYPTAGVGYESGTTPDGRRVHGWDTSAGVGVGVGGSPAPYPYPAPGASDRDRNVMAAELSDKSLPDGTVTAPVAGYLYFPAPSKRSSGVYQLDYAADKNNVRLYVPPPRN